MVTSNKDIIKELEIEEIEKIICNLLYKEYDNVLVTSILTKFSPSNFISDVTRNIFKICKKYYIKYNEIPDKIVIKSYLKSKIKDEDLLEEIKDVFLYEIDATKDISFYLELADHYLKISSLRKTILDSVDIIEEGNDDLLQIEENVRKALSQSIVVEEGIKYKESLNERIEIIKNFNETKFKTGFKSLDSFLDGGVTIPNLTTFLSKTHVGKTNTLLNIGFRQLQLGTKGVYISLEMSEIGLCKRIDAYVTEFNINKLYKSYKVDETIDKLKVSLDSYPGELLIKEFPPSYFTILDLRSFLLDLKIRGYDFDYVLLDYIGLMSYDPKKGMYNGLKEVAEQVRALSLFFKVPFFTAQQLNRGAWFKPFKELDMDSCGESMGIPFTSDVSFLIGHDPEDSLYKYEIKLKALKNRESGGVGTILTFYFNPGNLKLYDKSEEKEFIKSHGLSEVDLEYLEDEEVRQNSANEIRKERGILNDDENNENVKINTDEEKEKKIQAMLDKII